MTLEKGINFSVSRKKITYYMKIMSSCVGIIQKFN